MLKYVREEGSIAGTVTAFHAEVAYWSTILRKVLFRPEGITHTSSYSMLFEILYCKSAFSPYSGSPQWCSVPAWWAHLQVHHIKLWFYFHYNLI